MLNRNAEALFWIGRYMERAENHARLIDVHFHIQQDRDAEELEHKWARLVRALGADGIYRGQFDAYTQKDVLSFITLDRGYTNSLFSCVSQARQNLRSLREKLPTELWNVMNSFYMWLGDRTVEDIVREGPHSLYTQIKERTGTFFGVQQSVMARENEWYFIECGKYLERAENTVRILQSVIQAIEEDQAPAYLYLMVILKSVSGFQTFRRHYADGVSVEHVMEFMIGNSVFPRSMQFAFSRLTESLQQIEQSPDGSMPFAKERCIRLAGKVKVELDCLEKEDVALSQTGPLLEHLLQACHKLGDSMESCFFRTKGATA